MAVDADVHRAHGGRLLAERAPVGPTGIEEQREILRELLEEGDNPVDQAGQIIVFSQYMHKRDVNLLSSKHVKLVKAWDDVMELLQKQHRDGARVAVYPYSEMQHHEIDLT